MESDVIFFDNNATTRPLPAVQEAMLFSMNEGFGNPSSSHRGGESARRILSTSREAVANLISAFPSQIFFTSGATEANNWAIGSFLRNSRDARVLTTTIEHSSIKEMAENHFELRSRVGFIPVSSIGVVDVSELEDLCKTNSPGLVSIHWVNNETGAIQPIKDISAVCKSYGFGLHVDGSQAVGKMMVDASKIDFDFLTCSAHKIHGPQGIGALFCRERNTLGQLHFGGAQESGYRPGTENTPGIAGFGKAAEVRLENICQITAQLKELRDEFEQRVLASVQDVTVNCGSIERVCNTSNLRFAGVDGQALVAQLDAHGIQCSQSSACTTQIPEPSYVLRAMGLTEEEAYSSIRFSFSELNTFNEIEKVIPILTERVKSLREFKGSNTANK